MKQNFQQNFQEYNFEEVDSEIISHVRDSGQYYDFQAIDFLVGGRINNPQEVAYYGAGKELEESLEDFKNSEKGRAVISLHIPLKKGKKNNHFVGLYIERDGDDYTVFYIDPTGLDTLPNDVIESISDVLVVNDADIVRTTNMLQHSEEGFLTNVHCGAYVTEILTHLANETIRIDGSRLQTMTLVDPNSFVDVGDCDSEESSNNYGKKLRRSHEDLLSNDIDYFFELTQKNLSNMAVDNKRYNLTRSDSDMTNYTDLLSEMMDDQIGDIDLEEDKKREDDYEIFSIKVKSPKVDQIKEKLSSEKKEVRDVAKKKLEEKDSKSHKEWKTPQSKNARNTREYKKIYESSPEIIKLEEKLKKEKDRVVESPLSEDQQDQRLHLFRGKALNSRKLDKDGNSIERSSDEIKELITLKHKGISLKSDGIINNPERERIIRAETRKYLTEIRNRVKSGEEGATALFNAGSAYDSAVDDLMRRTGAKGNTVVATSKVPWVAAEYEAGNMGGAAGGDRAVAYGYDQEKKPVGRVLGNGYAISMLMKDYVKLRRDGDLIDVNVDMGKGVKVNQMIEEVTFNTEISGTMVAGSLPMVLPRFDRDYSAMTEEKKEQYKKVFNLGKKRYESYQKLFLDSDEDDPVPLGKIVEHLIMHHGFLLRELAIQQDRSADYDEKFMIPRNELFQSGKIDDIRLTGRDFASRTARVDNSEAKSEYIKQRSAHSAKSAKAITRLEDEEYLSDESPIKPRKMDFKSPASKGAIVTDEDVEDLGKSLEIFAPFASDASKKESPKASPKITSSKKYTKDKKEEKSQGKGSI